MTRPYPTLHTFRSHRLTLSYAAWGPVDGPILILVHGGRDHKRSWDWTARELRELKPGWRVIALDLRGHGQSDWVSDGQYTIMDHVFDLACLIEALGAQQVTLVGHSLGGNIVLRYSGLFPDRVRQLVAIEGLGPSPKLMAERAAIPQEQRLKDWIIARQAHAARQPRRMGDLAEAESRMRAAHPQLSTEQSAHLTRYGVRQNGDGSISWCYDPAVLNATPLDLPHDIFRRMWAAITAPVWLVYGAESWASNPEEDGRAVHFRNATTTVFEDAGHWVHHDQFAAFIEGLNSFLVSPQVR